MKKGLQLGDRPELRWIKLSELYIPSEYQRPIKSAASLKNIGHIQKNFNWASFGALIVCELEKSLPPQYAVIDGQHRMKAVEGIPSMKELPCVVINPKDLREQAHNFIEVNRNRVSLHSLHQHRAAVCAGETNAVNLESILRKAKVTLVSFAMSKGDVPPRATQAIGMLYKMMENYNEKHIVWALNIITEAFEGVNGCLRASMIKTMAEWSKLHPDTSRDVMIRALQGIDINQLERDARGYRAIEKKSMPEAFMILIEKKYNAAKKAA